MILSLAQKVRNGMSSRAEYVGCTDRKLGRRFGKVFLFLSYFLGLFMPLFWEDRMGHRGGNRAKVGSDMWESHNRPDPTWSATPTTRPSALWQLIFVQKKIKNYNLVFQIKSWYFHAFDMPVTQKDFVFLTHLCVFFLGLCDEKRHKHPLLAPTCSSFWL